MNSNKELAISNNQLTLKLFGDNFDLFPNGLIIHGQPSEQEYDEAFRRLSLIETSTSWWYGDLANARERDYGSLKEMAEILEINYNSLFQYQRVASAYELCNRLQSLSFKHHMIAAPLDDRLEWLKKAAEEGWSASRLQFEIRTNRNRETRLLLPPGTFNVIHADPPWLYYDTHMKSWGPTDLHYESLEVKDIADYKDPGGTSIKDKFQDDTVLFLWATNPKLKEALELVNHWGFDYKTNIVWVKTNLKRPGAGYYIRGHHELVFICTRGSIVPNQTNKSPISSIIESDAVIYSDIGEHSQKPTEIYELIENLYPTKDGYRYLDLFARNHRENWVSWGDQLDND